MVTINDLVISPYNPLRFDGTEMKPNLLLMCKLFFFLLVLHGFFYYIDDPYIPFVPFFEYLKSENHIFKNILRGVFFISGFFLVFNYRVRAMSILLGLVILLTLVASKPVFANHKLFCGCLFLLAGLSSKKKEPWLIYVQLSIVYFGAAINKVLQIDWWNGVYMQNWMVNVVDSHVFTLIAGLFPDFFMAKLLSISAMFIEFLLAILILFRKRHTLVVFIMLIFHTSLYTLTTLRFGHFYENMIIVLLVFLSWPAKPIVVYANNSFRNWVVIFLKFLESLNYLKIRNTADKYADSGSVWLKIKKDTEVKQNIHALRDLLLYNPLFYLTLFALDVLVRIIFDGSIIYFIRISFIWSIIIFFLIISFNKFKFDNNHFKV